MAMRQAIVTTIFGPHAEMFAKTFATFAWVPDAELHAFVFNRELPRFQDPRIRYHLVEHDASLVSVRRDALFRRWLLPDQLGAEYALVVDGTDVICVRPLPDFASLLRGGAVAAATEWGPPVPIAGQGFTGAYLNAGVSFWNLAESREMRRQIVDRGRARYRGPFDDQTALNEVVQSLHFERLTILPTQFNWRACFRRNLRNNYRLSYWPRADTLDGVYIYHNHACLTEVAEALRTSAPAAHARLEPLLPDTQPLSPTARFWRRLSHWWRFTG
jgi:hypothetical protein